ncbi:MAG: DNA polymerase III subunit epsilon [Pseudomonadota bacterium]
MSERQIILDTETTGLDPKQGHRMIEIGCVELIDRKLTDNNFHHYLQPDRQIEEGAAQVHGITDSFLRDKPRFAEIAEALADYLRDAEVIIHNAPFDVGFLNAEFARLPTKYQMSNLCQTITDTLTLARARHPGQRNNLDALCSRYQVDNTERTQHGALLDADILARVYLAMTSGQKSLKLVQRNSQQTGTLRRVKTGTRLPLMTPTAAELTAHTNYLDRLDQTSGGKTVWRHSG